MKRCESCGAWVDAGVRECRHCGMPVAPAMLTMPALAVSTSTETSPSAPGPAPAPSTYAALSPVIGATGEQWRSHESGDIQPMERTSDGAPLTTAGFTDWRAASASDQEPTHASSGDTSDAATADAAHALYPGYMQRAEADGVDTVGAPEQHVVGEMDMRGGGASRDLRAVSAYGLRYRDASVTSDKIQENATTSEPTEERAKGSIAMMTATSVARVIVRSVTEGSVEQEREFALDGRTVTVGRSPACDISLEGDQLASRRHALLRAEGDRYSLVDLGSSNGSFINDVEIQEPTVLHDGDRITIGEHDLLFLAGPASPSASIAGVRLDGEQGAPQAPMGETSPHVAIISVLDGQDDGPKQPSAQYDQPPQAASPDQFAASSSFAPPTPQMDDALIAPPAPPAPPAPVAPSAPPAGVITPITPPMPSSTASADALDQIRAQLTAASVALAQQSEAEARLADQRRATVMEISARLGDLLAQEQNVTMPSSSDVEALAQVARETAANPRHLDTLSALAARASDLAQALDAQKDWLAKRADLLNTLNALRAKLDQLG